MWEYEYAVESDASAEALWRCWSDVAGWPVWNAGIESISIDGPFAVGASFTMTPPGDEPITMRITEVSPGELFTDEADLGDVVVRTVHRLEAVGEGRTRVVYRTEITGPAAAELGPQIGPAITADFPEVIAALVVAAGRVGVSS
jgi:uncharacterized protein YndB with AHSA1/START domain